jgi:hypothetical protein
MMAITIFHLVCQIFLGAGLHLENEIKSKININFIYFLNRIFKVEQDDKNIDLICVMMFLNPNYAN